MKKPITFAGAAAAVLCLSSVGILNAEIVKSDPVRSVDNIPPTPVTGLLAVDTGQGVNITWNLSTDDAVSFTRFGNAIVPRGGVQGYRVYRSADNGADELLATLAPGASEYTDLDVLSGISYSYSVRPFDLDNETIPDLVPGSAEDFARLVTLGGTPPDIVVTTTVKASMTFAQDLNLDDQVALDAFLGAFIALLRDLLGIDEARIEIIDVRAGSTIVEFAIAEAPDGSDEPSGADALATLLALIADDAEDEFASLGTLTGIVDETSTDVVVVAQPIGEDGGPVLGWFTRQGDRVGAERLLPVC